VLKNSEIVTFNFLLYLKSVNVFGETLNVCSRDGINQACLTNTITTNESILGALNKLQSGVFKQMVTTNDNVDRNVNVCFEINSLVVTNLRWRNVFLFLVELGHLVSHFQVLCCFLLCLSLLKSSLLGGDLGYFRFVELRDISNKTFSSHGPLINCGISINRHEFADELHHRFSVFGFLLLDLDSHLEVIFFLKLLLRVLAVYHTHAHYLLKGVSL